MLMPSRRAVRSIGTASELDRCSRCTGAPVCRAASIRCAIAMFSDAARPGGQEVGVVPPARCRGALDRASSPPRGRSSSPRRPASTARYSSSWSADSGGNSSTPESVMKHLNPKTPASCRPRRSAMLPGTRRPRTRRRRARCPRADFRLICSAVDRARGRDAVERHVEDGRDAARRRGPGGGREALPLGAAGLVDVHVAVDEAGQQHLVVGEVDGLGALEPRLERLDRDDHAVADGDAAAPPRRRG